MRSFPRDSRSALRKAQTGSTHAATIKAGAVGIHVKVKPTFEKMADLMGVARPSLSRELSRMKVESLIDIEGRTIIIENLEALRHIRGLIDRLR